MNPLDALFAGVGDANMGGGGNYFRDGKYRALVDKIECKRNGGDYTYICETVIETAVATEPAEVCPAGPNPVGSKASIVIKSSGDQDRKAMAAGKLKRLALALMGVNEDQFVAMQQQKNAETAAAGQPPVDLMAAFLTRAYASDQPLTGRAIEVETYRKATKKQKAEGKGGEAFRSEWNCYQTPKPVAGQTAETVAAGREKISTLTGTAPVAAASVPAVQNTAPAIPANLPPPAPLPAPPASAVPPDPTGVVPAAATGSGVSSPSSVAPAAATTPPSGSGLDLSSLGLPG